MLGEAEDQRAGGRGKREEKKISNVKRRSMSKEGLFFFFTKVTGVEKYIRKFRRRNVFENALALARMAKMFHWNYSCPGQTIQLLRLGKVCQFSSLINSRLFLPLLWQFFH